MILNNKVAFVTGGSRGIGKEISFALAKEGAKVFLTYNTKIEMADKVVSAIKALGGDAITKSMDVRNRQDVNRALQKCIQSYKKIDILVNCAGINNPNDFDRVTDEEWDDILDVNLKGTFIVLDLIMKFDGFLKVIIQQ